MTLPATTTLIFALGVWLTPPLPDLRPAGIAAPAQAPVEWARQRRLPKCTRVKRAPCEMMLPEQESSEPV